MDSTLLFRGLTALLIAALGIGAYAGLNRLMLFRTRNRSAGVEAFKAGLPALLYFSSPTCVPCRTIQKPAVDRLGDSMKDTLQVIEINTEERPDLASAWGILSVPTTIVLDSRGKPRSINHGVVGTDTLRKQVAKV